MNNLKRIRTSRNITTQELSDLLNINRTTITRLENGETSLSDHYIQIFTEFFGVSADYLLGLPEKAIPLGDGTFKPVPVLGSVNAGSPKEMIEMNVGYLMAKVDNPEDYFYLHVDGDSMSPTFEDGDYVLVKFQQCAEHNDIVVAGLNGDEATVKRYKEIGTDKFLFPDNDKYQPTKLVEELNPFFVGVVKGFSRMNLK